MTIVRKTKHSDGAGLNFILSDATPDRYDDVIDPNGWDLKNFSKNPIALFNHNNDFPIGRWENPRVRDGGLHGRLVMAPAGTSSRHDEIRKLISAGVLRAVSVGFRPLESKPRKDSKSGGVFYGKSELVEVSLVCVPANQNALLQAKALGVSTKMIREIFKEQNRNASLADRIAESRLAVKKYDAEELAAIHRKAKAMLASKASSAKPEKETARSERLKAESRARVERAERLKAESRARVAKRNREEREERDAKLDPPKVNQEAGEYYVWRGQRFWTNGGK